MADIVLAVKSMLTGVSVKSQSSDESLPRVRVSYIAGTIGSTLSGLREQESAKLQVSCDHGTQKEADALRRNVIGQLITKSRLVPITDSTNGVIVHSIHIGSMFNRVDDQVPGKPVHLAQFTIDISFTFYEG